MKSMLIPLVTTLFLGSAFAATKTQFTCLYSDEDFDYNKVQTELKFTVNNTDGVTHHYNDNSPDVSYITLEGEYPFTMKYKIQGEWVDNDLDDFNIYSAYLNLSSISKEKVDGKEFIEIYIDDCVFRGGFTLTKESDYTEGTFSIRDSQTEMINSAVTCTKTTSNN